jgi:membrane protein YdbS with pleckstrin-like domain
MPKVLTPSPKYLVKTRVVMVIVAALVWLGSALLGTIISLSDKDASILLWFIGVTLVVDVVWLVPALLLAGPYYRSLIYEIHEEEVVVRAGIWTKSVKHVPYRTVTHLTVKRGLLDRWVFQLGTLDIQTAGTSGTTEAEQSLVGLDDVDGVYEMVVAELRRFRGAMAPTASGAGDAVERAGAPLQDRETLGGILAEVRAIRQSLDKGQEGEGGPAQDL